MSILARETVQRDRITIDLHIHTLDDPKDAVDYSAHQFYVLGGSIGRRLLREIDCFDAIEFCHFHKGFLNPNRRAAKVASQFGKPLIATSDAHRLHAFGRHYTSIPSPPELTIENVFTTLRSGRVNLTSPPCSFDDLVSAIYFVFLAHPFRRLRKGSPQGQRSLQPRTRSDA